MAEIQLLGLLHEATPTAEALEQLKQYGISDDQITVISSVPYRPNVLGRPHPIRRVGPIALVGGVLGLLFGLFLTVGIFLLYPLQQGGQPIVPIPPTLIVLFESTMLGTMIATFFGLLDGFDHTLIVKLDIAFSACGEGVCPHCESISLFERIIGDALDRLRIASSGQPDDPGRGVIFGQ